MGFFRGLKSFDDMIQLDSQFFKWVSQPPTMDMLVPIYVASRKLHFPQVRGLSTDMGVWFSGPLQEHLPEVPVPGDLDSLLYTPQKN